MVVETILAVVGFLCLGVAALWATAEILGLFRDEDGEDFS